MKVAIVTFQRTGSYGAVLQMYSLQKAFKSIPQIECKVIDFYNESIEKVYKPIHLSKVHSIKEKAKALLYYCAREKNWNTFNIFIDKNIDLTDHITINNISKYSDSFDVYIAGSDQIWHTGMNGGNNYYFLDFVNNSRKKYSYAASFGRQYLPQNEKELYSKLLCDFECISIREKDIAPELEELLHRRIDVSPDPTLLHDADFWKEKASNINKTKPYILIYTVLDPINIYKKAEEISKKEKLEILVLNGNRRKIPKQARLITNIDPFEFLGYINNAKYIFTNSFHATVFSILFHKNFFVELNQQYLGGNKIEHIYNNRIANLLTEVGIDNRTIESTESINMIDWIAVDEKLKEMRIKGWSYIYEILENAKKRN